MKHLLSIFLIIIIHSVSTSQQVLEKVYDITSGLLFQEVTNVFKDDNGNLLVEYSNQEAISRFDGISWSHFEFQKYRMPSGLAFERLTNDGIWFVKINSIAKESEFVLFDKNDNWKYWKVKGNIVSDPFNTLEEPTFVSHSNQIYEFVDSAFIATSKFLPEKIEGHDFNIYSFTYMDKNNVTVYAFNENNLSQKLILYDFGSQEVLFSSVIKNPVQNVLPLAPFKYINVVDNSILTDIKSGKNIYTFNKNSLLHKDGLLTYINCNNKFNACQIVKNESGKKDLYFYNEMSKNFELKYSNLNEGLMTGSIVLDGNNSIWYPSQGGLIKRTPQILSFLESNTNMVNGLHTISEDELSRIWFGGYNNSGWVYWDGIKLQRPLDNSLKNNRILPGSKSFNGKIYYYEENNTPTNLSYIEKGLGRKVDFPEAVSPGFFFQYLKSGKMAGGLAGKGLLIFNPLRPSEYKIINKQKGLFLQNVLTISEDKYNRIWMGRMSQGIACYDLIKDTVVTWLISTDNPKSLGMLSSIIDNKDNLWLGTSLGLHFLPNPHLFDIQKLSLFDHLIHIHLPGELNDRITSITENKKFIITGTEKGLFLIDKIRPPDIEGRMRVYSFNYNSDIPGKGSEQNSILVDRKGYLWLGTQEGALMIDIDNLNFDTSKTNLNISSVKFGGSLIDHDGSAFIGPEGKRSVDITWTVNGNTHFQDNIFATIIVVSDKNDTIYFKNQTKDKNISIPHLPPAKYKLIVKTYKNNQLDVVLEKFLIIPKLLSEKTWFWVMLVFLLSLIPFILVLNYSRSRRKFLENKLFLEQSKRSQDLYRIKSLSNFFNPHFINNTLHWLQGKYRKDEETTTMIDSLANNVYLLYQNIQLGVVYHSLQKELKIVDNYIEIQQVKFGYSLNVVTSVSPDIEPSTTLIPSMLMQIHVENAIEKGIRNRLGASQLSISISQEKENYIISIEDDGRGRSLLKLANKTRKGSTSVMNDLISILNSYNTNKILVSYDDLIWNEKYGTRVNIILPKEYNYDLDKIQSTSN